jgi:hypothetical protein
MSSLRRALCALLILQTAHSFAQNAVALPPVVVYAPAPCLACTDWANRLRQHGFVVTQEEKQLTDMPRIKHWLNVPSQFESVQTARVASYFVEGLVPVDDILRLLKEKPAARGLTASNPAGDGPPADDSGQNAVKVMLVGHDGHVSAYARKP